VKGDDQLYLYAGKDRYWLDEITRDGDASFASLGTWKILEIIPEGRQASLDEALRDGLVRAYRDDGSGHDRDFDGSFHFWLGLHMGETLTTKIEREGSC
jgi:hypothetical protein